MIRSWLENNFPARFAGNDSANLAARIYKMRRLAVGRLRRVRRWEFWSARVFYVPVLFYIAFLALRYRRPTIFTAANPAIEAGGFTGESKDKIYRGLREAKENLTYLLRHVFLPKDLNADEKLRRAKDFIAQNRLTFPLAVKPDAGERGAGVFIVKSEAELKRRLTEIKADAIVQEFADGFEFGVFYYRFPSESEGKIFAVTEKRFPEVSGDGAANLETLILRDERAVCLAKSYFERNRERLQTIPAKGEKVKIVDIGTHSRGAIFLDGGWVKTDALESAIDRVCRNYKGFYFGRFDVRTPSIEDFRRGENFKIVELNGVTSEATSIYDPKNSLLDAYRVLFRQWRIAFEIGAQNARRGAAKPTSVRKLVKMILVKNEK
jgi:hypothetical protein